MFEQQLAGDARTPKLRGIAMGSVSLTLHMGALAALWLLWLMGRGDIQPKPRMPGMMIDLPQLVVPKIAVRAEETGGGDESKLPVSRGDVAPPRAMKVFILPVTNPQAQLKMQVSMPAMDAPVLDSGQYGDPNADPGAFSLGPGGPDGMGRYGTGGLGNGGGHNVFRAGMHGVTMPILVLKTEPEYSDEARRVKRSGTVTLKIVVDAKGLPSSILVMQPLGFGLDESAVDAVRHWRFKPGLKDGRPVPVEAVVEVSFRLL
jgi:TonB family protein